MVLMKRTEDDTTARKFWKLKLVTVAVKRVDNMLGTLLLLR